jgi:hypothetical protein
MKQELSKAKLYLTKENTMLEKYDSNIPISKKLTEDIFISEIHDKIIDLRELVGLTNEIALLISYEAERNSSQKKESYGN